MSFTVQALTCARNPQKSHIRSAHLKFAGSRLNVLDRLHFGQAQFCATNRSPTSPVICCSVANGVPVAGDLPSQSGSDQAGDQASMIRAAAIDSVIARSTAPHLPQATILPATSRVAGISGVACAESSKLPPTLRCSGRARMPVARRSKSSRTYRPEGSDSIGIRRRSRLCSTRLASGISPKKIFALQSAKILLRSALITDGWPRAKTWPLVRRLRAFRNSQL